MSNIGNPVKSLSLALCAALSIGHSSLGHAQDEANRTYEMRAYSNGFGGSEALAGDYEAAIRSASVGTSGLEDSLTARTNLCVAHTVRGEFSAAAGSCERALRLARRVDGVSRTLIRSRTATALALTNRGVLRAVAGDAADAAADFRRAARIDGTPSAASRNMAYLERSESNSLALAREIEFDDVRGRVR